MTLRQPIITVLGHVDHGKTTTLDFIRQTTIASKEAGGITQAIGTTEIPKDVIVQMCSNLLKQFSFNINFPGLLFIDTPGHEAFITLRRRGGTIADLAILVVDIIEGIMPQTVESIQILKDSRTPFVVAFNKIDRLEGWVSNLNVCFMETFQKQSDETKAVLEQRFYETVQQFSHYGIFVERFDRVTDFTKIVAGVPISAKTGEGITDLLVVLSGLSQQFLRKELIISDEAEGMILEVKDVTGLGTTIDCIIYNGTVEKNDFISIGGNNMISKIKALFIPESLRDMRTGKRFKSTDKVTAACGVKIVAPGLDNVIAGSPIKFAKTLEDAEKMLNQLENEQEAVEIHTDKEGILLKADTIGCIEALINIFKSYPIKDAYIGHITKQDIIKVQGNKEITNRIVIGFETHLKEDVMQFAKDSGVRVIESNVIYKLIEDYKKFVSEEQNRIKRQEIDSLSRAGKLKIVPGCVFRASNPAIVGCEVIGGFVKPGSTLIKNGVSVGEIKQMQSQGQNVSGAKSGDKIAVSITGPTVGRQINESDILYTDVSSDDYKKMQKLSNLITSGELVVIEEIKEIKRKTDMNWGM